MRHLVLMCMTTNHVEYVKALIYYCSESMHGSWNILQDLCRHGAISCYNNPMKYVFFYHASHKN